MDFDIICTALKVANINIAVITNLYLHVNFENLLFWFLAEDR